MPSKLRELLFSLRDESYAAFSSRLVPKTNLIGVRVPLLHNLAKKIAKADYENYLHQPSFYLEEKLLKGLLVGYLKIDFSKTLDYLYAFLPEIDSWEVCDLTASNLKIFKKNLYEGQAFIIDCLKQNEEFTIRFALVLLLSYYIEEEYFPWLIEIVSKIKSEEYYVNMALAWLISIMYIKFPGRTLELLDGRLTDFVHNKAISKITDSYRVSKEEKNFLRTIRIKQRR